MNLLIILVITNFLKTLFIIVLIYYAIRLVTRYILPLLVDKGLKNMQQKMQEQQRQVIPTQVMPIIPAVLTAKHLKLEKHRQPLQLP